MTVCLFLSATLGAQNQVLTDIEQANAAYKTVEGAFTRTQTNAAKGTSDKAEGTLYLSGDDCMAQHYKAPCPDVLIINADDFYMVRGKKTNKFNTAKNKPMRSLRNTLLYCLHGKPAVLAAETVPQSQPKRLPRATKWCWCPPRRHRVAMPRLSCCTT